MSRSKSFSNEFILQAWIKTTLIRRTSYTKNYIVPHLFSKKNLPQSPEIDFSFCCSASLPYTKYSISSCAASTLRNIANGYTVAYPTDGASDTVCSDENARAGGFVEAPDNTPVSV